MLDLNAFLALPTAEVARLVAERPRTCVFPINGTRRWYLLERLLGEWAAEGGAPPSSEAEYLSDYLARTAQAQVALARLFFSHGIRTLMVSLFGSSLLERGDDYVSIGFEEGLARIGRDPAYHDFYREMGVRVRFYGDYRRVLPGLGYAHLIDLFDEVMAATRGNDRHLLMFGLCADDPLETVARLAIAHHQAHGRPPTKRELTAAYYGEELDGVDLFIGFDKPCVFDVPLLDMGDADLYYLVSPSPYLAERQLRRILYDHLYARRMAEQDYTDLSPAALQAMKAFYDLNREATLGLGRKHAAGDFWYPVPQVRLPDGMEG